MNIKAGLTLIEIIDEGIEFVPGTDNCNFGLIFKGVVRELGDADSDPCGEAWRTAQFDLKIGDTVLFSYHTKNFVMINGKKHALTNTACIHAVISDTDIKKSKSRDDDQPGVKKLVEVG